MTVKKRTRHDYQACADPPTTENATIKGVRYLDVGMSVKRDASRLPSVRDATGTPLPRTFEYPEGKRAIIVRHDYQACAMIPTGTPLPRTLDILKERAMRARHD